MSDEEFSITQEEFVQEFKGLKDELLKDYFSKGGDISRVGSLSAAGINSDQIEIIKTVVDDALTDALYTVLLALDGCASIHQHQIEYKVQDETGNELTGGLDSLAYEALREECS